MLRPLRNAPAADRTQTSLFPIISHAIILSRALDLRFGFQLGGGISPASLAAQVAPKVNRSSFVALRLSHWRALQTIARSLCAGKINMTRTSGCPNARARNYRPQPPELSHFQTRRRQIKALRAPLIDRLSCVCACRLRATFEPFPLLMNQRAAP